MTKETTPPKGLRRDGESLASHHGLRHQITGLLQRSSIMVDKVTSTPRSKLGEHLGAVFDTTMLALSRALVVFLGMTDRVRLPIVTGAVAPRMSCATAT